MGAPGDADARADGLIDLGGATLNPESSFTSASAAAAPCNRADVSPALTFSFLRWFTATGGAGACSGGPEEVIDLLALSAAVVGAGLDTGFTAGSGPFGGAAMTEGAAGGCCCCCCCCCCCGGCCC